MERKSVQETSISRVNKVEPERVVTRDARQERIGGQEGRRGVRVYSNAVIYVSETDKQGS